MVTYEEFKEFIVEMAETEMGNRAVVNPVHKNNGLNLDGLIIMSEDSNMVPTIYLNRYYEQYKEIMDEPDALESIWRGIKEYYYQHLPVNSFDVDSFTDYEKVKGNLRLKLVNYKKNKEWLDDVVFIPFLDLAGVVVVNVKMEKGKVGTITVTKSHMVEWEKNEEDLLHDAMENMKDDYIIMPMEEILKERLEELGIADIEELAELSMYVLYNRQRLLGAGLMMVPNVMREAAELMGCDNIVIIPSSVHETMLLPCEEGKTDFTEMTEIIREVNQNSLEEEEILSDHPYLYCREQDKIVCVCSYNPTIKIERW
jgi:hypothetical protein